jgi:hypothetical protein
MFNLLLPLLIAYGYYLYQLQEKKTGKPSPPFSLELRQPSNLLCLAFIFGSPLAFLHVLNLYPPLSGEGTPIFWQLPLGFYFLGLVLTIVFLRRWATEELPTLVSRTLGIVLLPVPLAVLGPAIVLFANGHLDTSKIKNIQYTVIRGHCNGECSLDVTPEQSSALFYQIIVDNNTYRLTHIGDNFQVGVRTGYFNIPWIVNYKNLSQEAK